MRITCNTIVLSCLLTILVVSPGLSQTKDPLRGFSSESSRIQRDWEKRFQAIPNPDSLREYMRILSARPHHLGSAPDSVNAAWILNKFKSWGLDATIETFQVLFPTPLERVVELVGPERFVAKLREPAVPGDPTTSQQKEQLPTYNAYSPDGDVTAPLVFVNYGVPEDYERLDRLGVSVKGAIVIAKYGQSWRGIKPKVAAEHGAVGCLIYSDPADDGYHAGDVYPKGAFRPAEGVQRGSIMDMPLYPGDPLTPGVGAIADAKRLNRSEARSLPTIPTQPLSYADAEPLLRALAGAVAPHEWAGSLPITYHVGPGPARVHLKLRFNWKLTPLHDVIARIPGSSAADEWVIRGNHHDAWVNGAEDPISGLVALLEEARGFAQLRKAGWQPRRTIIFAAWDGEEPMLLGSTEWVEAHAAELERRAVAYLNSDTNDRGFLSAGGSPSLTRLTNDVARDLIDPETKMSIWKRARSKILADADAAERKRIRSLDDLELEPLGSGSDYTAFFDHAGIASLNFGFGGEDDGGVYHSIYDSFRWYTSFSDTAFVFGRALAQTAGTTILRLADAQVIPFEFTRVGSAAAKYLKEVQDLWKKKRDAVEEQNLELDDSVFAATNDPRRPLVAPKREEVPPHVSLAAVENGLDRVTIAAKNYEQALTAAAQRGLALSDEQAQRINSLLMRAEHALTNADGLPRRPWYKHLLSAPGWYTGYSPKTLPGVREAIEAKKWKEAEEQGVKIGQALEREAATIDSATSELGKVAGH
jgi:N-acetylated-alpha-linked acidic dipeptidase